MIQLPGAWVGRGRSEGRRKRRKGRNSDEEKSMLASNHFLMCTPQSGPFRDVFGVIQRREEGGRRQRWSGG